MKNFFSQQNKMLEKIFHRALDQGVFSGAALAVSQGCDHDEQRLISCHGHTSYHPQERQEIGEQTFFDLASLTKPLATLPALLHLIQAGKFTFDTPIGEILREKIPRDKEKITLADLITHRSGLAAYQPFFKQLKKNTPARLKEQVLALILRQPLLYPTGSRSLYSDPGFILAGLMVERQSGMDLASYVDKQIYRPLGLQDKIFFNTANHSRPGVYATGEYCLWRRRLLRGEVGDENCALLGGVAGHAGLFGNISAVADLLSYFLALGWGAHPAAEKKGPLARRTFIQCCQPWDKSGGNSWAGGFDTPTPGGSSGGDYLSPSSIGHLGFAGTSFWLDPPKQLIMVLLTNRVHPCRSNEKIKKFRPYLHNKIIQELGLRHRLPTDKE